jgi:hypothetical protein
MLILIATLLALIPTAAILYPFVFKKGISSVFHDETSTYSELTRRWEASVAGLKSTELEHAIGNLMDDDYADLKEQYMLEAARVLKAMELEDQQEDELLASVSREVRAVRERFSGPEPQGTEGQEQDA